MSVGTRNLLLVVVAVLIAGVPALMALGVLPSLVPNAPWTGGDTQITETVGALKQDYRPWFQSLIKPGAMERYMFGLQALLGTLAAAWFLGWLVGRRNAQTGREGNERKTATIVSVIGMVVAIALFFVQTDLGELQAFITSLQGVCLGTLGFFAGYPMGRRARVGQQAHESISH